MIKPRRKASAQKSATKNAKGNFAEPSFGALVSEQSSGTGPFSTPFNEVGPDLALNVQSRDLIQKIADWTINTRRGKLGTPNIRTQRAAWKQQLIESLGASTASSR
jgi:hypothetical protein